MRLFAHRRRSGGRAAVHWLEAMLLILGTICFCWFGYNWIASQADQIWSNYTLDASLAGEQPSATGFWRFMRQGHTHTEASVGVLPPAVHRKQVPSGENIGRIEIPRLGISAIVRQGVDDRILSRAVGHVPSTALPGEKGNVGLAAHRDSYFRNLRDVREGDTIRIVSPDGTWEYAVESTEIVRPTNVEVLDPTSHASVTLVTCYPFNYVGHAPKRFIVRARLRRDSTTPAREASVSVTPSPTGKRRHS